jgi:PAS domain S-box-containing protein
MHPTLAGEPPAPSALAPGASKLLRVYGALVGSSFALVAGFYLFGESLRQVMPPVAYVPLHTLFEVLSVVVGFAIFAVHWHAARSRDLVDRRALFLGAAFLVMASVDVLHLMTYRSMPGLFGAPGNPDRAIHYWLVSRFVLMASLLAVVAIPRQSAHPLLSRPVLLGAALAIVILAAVTDVVWVRPGLFFVEGRGLTPLKIGLEVTTIALAAIGCVLFGGRLLRRGHHDSLAWALPAALAITIGAGLCFTLYTAVSDTFNLLGHVLKVVASYLIFDALFVSALLRPYEELDEASRDLAGSNRELDRLRRHVEGELAETIARLEATSESERRAKERAEATAERLAAVLRVTDATLEPPDLDTLLAVLLDRLCEALRVDLATVHLVAQDGRHLEPRATHGLDEELREHLRIRVGEGIAGQIACRREPLVIDDLSRASVASPTLRAKARSLLGMPLLLGERVIGVIEVATAAPRRFTDDDLALLRVVADRVAGAIDRARLLAEQETTLASIPDPLIVYDERGTPVRVNCPAQKLLGYAPEDYARDADERWRSLRIADADGRRLLPEETPMARALRGETVSGLLLRVEPPGGETRWVSASAAPIAGPGHRPIGAVFSFPDVTRVREEEARREDLLRAVSHDLRSPLAAMRLQAQRLERALAQDAPDGAKKGLDAIVRAADRMAHMIEDLVDSERLSAGKLALETVPVDLRAELRELTGGSTGGIDPARLDLELPADLPPALGDPARIDRILTNLLTNACKYSPADTRIRVGAAAREHEVELWVADRGQGIAPEDQARIFTRYFRARNARADGLGLGLFITRMLVEAQGGRISLESRPGEGSTFRFTLPRPPAQSSGANPAA